MDKLKYKILKYFLIFSLATGVFQSIVDSIYDDWLFLRFGNETTVMQWLIVSYILLNIMIFVAFAYWFYGVISKRINEEVHRQVNERNMLYAIMAHDLKTPITSILGFSKALRDGKVKESQREDILNTICMKAQQTDELIHSLSCYSKLETQDYPMNFTQTDICRLVRDLLATQYEEFEEKEMDLLVDIPETSIICSLDSLEFTRAVGNLIRNACVHNNIGSRIFVGVKKAEGKIEIMVADNGEPISEAIRENIFDPFVCEDESRNSKGGSGLGLAIAKKIVEKHGGTLRISDTVEGYTKAFIIELSL